MIWTGVVATAARLEMPLDRQGDDEMLRRCWKWLRGLGGSQQRRRWLLRAGHWRTTVRFSTQLDPLASSAISVPFPTIRKIEKRCSVISRFQPYSGERVLSLIVNSRTCICVRKPSYFLSSGSVKYLIESPVMSSDTWKFREPDQHWKMERRSLPFFLFYPANQMNSVGWQRRNSFGTSTVNCFFLTTNHWAQESAPVRMAFFLWTNSFQSETPGIFSNNLFICRKALNTNRKFDQPKNNICYSKTCVCC